MIKHVLYFVVIAAVMLLLSRLLPGFEVTGWGPALLAAVVLALMNTLVKPILFVLTLPFILITLGLFLFVLNAIVLWLTALLVPGFHLHGIATTLIASLVLSLVSMMWKSATKSATRIDV